MQDDGPQAEHRWLQKLAGDWHGTGEAALEPGKAPWAFAVDETVRPLGELWIVGEGRGMLPDGGPAWSLLTLGFDPRQGRFVGSFVGSMMSHFWIYAGSLDAAGLVLTLRTEGPDPASGRMVPFEDIHQLVGQDGRMLRSRMQRGDGSWQEIMTAHYRRKTPG